MTSIGYERDGQCFSNSRSSHLVVATSLVLEAWLNSSTAIDLISHSHYAARNRSTECSILCKAECEIMPLGCWLQRSSRESWMLNVPGITRKSGHAWSYNGVDLLLVPESPSDESALQSCIPRFEFYTTLSMSYATSKPCDI